MYIVYARGKNKRKIQIQFVNMQKRDTQNEHEKSIGWRTKEKSSNNNNTKMRTPDNIASHYRQLNEKNFSTRAKLKR